MGVGGGIGELTVGSTLSAGITRSRVLIMGGVRLRTVGAGTVTRVLTGLGANGGILLILPRGGRIICGDTHGVRNIGIIAMGALYMCSVLGYGRVIILGSTTGGVRRMCTW